MILFVGFLFISEYRFSYKSALKARIKAKDIEFIELIYVNKDLDLAVYKNLDDEIYGWVEYFNLFHTIYRPGSSGRGYAMDKQGPFLVVSNQRENKYIIFIKTNDPRIKYVSIGTEKRSFTNEDYEKYTVSFDEVKRKPEVYQIKTLKDGSTSFEGEATDYQQFIDKNTIMGFDESGNLIADRRAEMFGRYIKK
jgi:hypothetical protein